MGSEVVDTARYVLPALKEVRSTENPLRIQRPDCASYSTLGSLKPCVDGTGKKRFRSATASSEPVLDHTDRLSFVASTTALGPAATWVSGGWRAWSLPKREIC